MSEFHFESVGPHSGECRSLVVLLHGYGANGADLKPIAEALAPHLPDTLFVSPDAPEQCIASPFGRQWFPLPDIDGSSIEDAEAGLLRSADNVSRFLAAQMDAHDLLPEQIGLIGFSQGTMLGLHVAPRMEESIAGMVAFSGRLLRPELLADEMRSDFPVLLAHGDQDEVVPPASLPQAVEALQAAGFEHVYAHVMKGTGHGIAPDGLQVALAFLRDELGF